MGKKRSNVIRCCFGVSSSCVTRTSPVYNTELHSLSSSSDKISTIRGLSSSMTNLANYDKKTLVMRRRNSNTVTPVNTAFAHMPGQPRPPLAPKPKFSGLSTMETSHAGALRGNEDYDKPRSPSLDSGSINWRSSRQPGALINQSYREQSPSSSGQISNAPKWNIVHSSSAPIALAYDGHSRRGSDSDSTVLHDTSQDEAGAPSPSSSGIVADLLDPSSDSYQRASGVSSVSACSSSDRSSEHNDSDCITPRFSATGSDTSQNSANSSSAHHKYYGTTKRDSFSTNGTKPLESQRYGSNCVTTDNFISSDTNGGGTLYDDANARKQSVCNRLTEHLREIESNSKRLDECTAPRGWRQPHVLQQHLLDIKDCVSLITDNLDSFLDDASRIVVDGKNSKSEDLVRLLTPVQNSLSLVKRARLTLDRTGWTLAALARPRSANGGNTGNDALDQFVAIVKQIPVDCHKLLQWILTVPPSSCVTFLPLKMNTSINGRNEYSRIYQPNRVDLSRILPTDSHLRDPKRDSTGSSLSSQSALSSSDIQTPPSILSSRNSGFESDSSANTNTLKSSGDSVRPKVTFADNLTTYRPYSNGNGSVDGRVMEEDDLESIVSDRESLTQDYAMATAGESVSSLKRRPRTSKPPTKQLSPDVLQSLSDSDRELLRFYSPQLASHTEFLSRAIDDFLAVVEEQRQPAEFIQKGKLIILAAHKLVYIGDNIAQCISLAELANEVRRAADRLCAMLKNCVQATKQAADQYPQVSAVQAMVDSVLAVSHDAHDLKLLIEECC
ncbi:hypothetical protein AB6A40_005116 [Gnathostoma spinigerum]|uniref:CAS family C-terminal domain-containing protein n=1 Tax=Gnathostoma spinigerum TaxID=75299 RepID=A0ABD6ENZ8_9BILA